MFARQLTELIKNNAHFKFILFEKCSSAIQPTAAYQTTSKRVAKITKPAWGTGRRKRGNLILSIWCRSLWMTTCFLPALTIKIPMPAKLHITGLQRSMPAAAAIRHPSSEWNLCVGYKPLWEYNPQAWFIILLISHLIGWWIFDYCRRQLVIFELEHQSNTEEPRVSHAL